MTRRGRTSWRRWARSTIVASCAVGLAACGLVAPGTEPVQVQDPTADTTIPTTAAPPSTPAPMAVAPAEGTTQLPIFFVRAGQLGAAVRTFPADPDIVAKAVDALLAGPTDIEVAAGLSSAVPALSKVRSMTLGDGNVVTVDLTGSFASLGPANSAALRLAQIVYTITTFPVTVRFQIDGQTAKAIGGYILPDRPLSRDDFVAWAPPILLESVGPGQTLEPGRDISGSTGSAGAQVGVQLTDAAGNVIFQGSASASDEPGLRHFFRTAAQFSVTSPGPGTLTLSELTPSAGSTPVVLAVPVELG